MTGEEPLFKFALEYKSLRHLVIDNSVTIEEAAAETLSYYLNIDLKNSKSLGHSSAGLTFNNKMSILGDMVEVDGDKSKKLIQFGQIRNKFAHVSQISTWKDFFGLSSTYSKIGKNLDDWYGTTLNKPEYSFETRYTVYYQGLSLELNSFFYELIVKWAEKAGKKHGIESYKDFAYDTFLKKASEEKVVSLIWDEIDEKVKNGALKINPEQALELVRKTEK